MRPKPCPPRVPLPDPDPDMQLYMEGGPLPARRRRGTRLPEAGRRRLLRLWHSLVGHPHTTRHYRELWPFYSCPCGASRVSMMWVAPVEWPVVWLGRAIAFGLYRRGDMTYEGWLYTSILRDFFLARPRRWVAAAVADLWLTVWSRRIRWGSRSAGRARALTWQTRVYDRLLGWALR